MDYLQDYMTMHLPSSVLSHLSTHSSTYFTIQKYLLYINATTQTALGHAFTILNTLFTRLLNSPDIATVLLLIVVLLLSLKLLDLLRRAVLFWITLAFRIAFWASIAGVGLWVWSRGPAGFVDDLGALVGVWRKEYGYWADQAEAARRYNDRKGKTF